MISWEPVAMRSGVRVDRAFVDAIRIDNDLFIRKRTPSTEGFEIDGTPLPAGTREAAALAAWRARGAAKGNSL